MSKDDKGRTFRTKQEDAARAHYFENHNRVETARLRQEEAEGRTPSDRLAALDARLGVGQGAERERARLEAAL